MNDEKLIKLVHSHVELYDVSHVKYMDIDHRERIWKEVGHEMKLEGSVCKTRWNNIRDNYRKSIRKIISKSGQAKRKKYKYNDHLRFLDAYLKRRNPKGNHSEDAKEEKCNLAEPEPKDKHQEDVNSEQVIDEQSNKVYAIQQSDCSPLHISSVRTLKRTCKQRKVPPTLLQHIPKNECKPSSQVHSDAVDAFLAGLSPTLKSLTPYYLNMAKTKIFSAVQEYEMEMIMENERHTLNHNMHQFQHTSSDISSTPSPSPSIQSIQSPCCSPIHQLSD